MSWLTFVCAASYSIAALFVAKLTPADVTPLAAASASWTVAAQLAQVIPSMGRTIRVLLMAGIVEFVRRRRGAALAGRLHDEQPFQHVHAATEGILARLLGSEFDRGRLKGRQLLIDTEALEHHALGAVGGLIAIELQPHRFPCLHDDRVGRVATLHGDVHVLHAAPPGAGRRGDSRAARQEEVPQHPDDGDGAERRDGDLGRRHVSLVSAPARAGGRGQFGALRPIRSAWRRTIATRIPARSGGTRWRARDSTWRRARP